MVDIWKILCSNEGSNSGPNPDLGSNPNYYPYSSSNSDSEGKSESQNIGDWKDFVKLIEDYTDKSEEIEDYKAIMQEYYFPHFLYEFFEGTKLVAQENEYFLINDELLEEKEQQKEEFIKEWFNEIIKI